MNQLRLIHLTFHIHLLSLLLLGLSIDPQFRYHLKLICSIEVLTSGSECPVRFIILFLVIYFDFNVSVENSI